MNYYPFHIGDYASTTRHLSWDEDMAYRRLIDAYYTRELPIPADKRAAYRLACATTDSQRAAVDVVLSEFFALDERGEWWINARCEAVIQAVNDKSKKAAQSASVRWTNAKAQPTQSERNANASDEACERIENAYEGNAPNTNTKTKYISTDVDIKTIRAPRFDARAHLSSLGVPDQIAIDWIAHRRAKRATPTRTAIDRIAIEAVAAGLSLGDALGMCCERGWMGFKAYWLLDQHPAGQRRQTVTETRTETVATLTGRIRNANQFEERDVTPGLLRLAK